MVWRWSWILGLVLWLSLRGGYEDQTHYGSYHLAKAGNHSQFVDSSTVLSSQTGIFTDGEEVATLEGLFTNPELPGSSWTLGFRLFPEAVFLTVFKRCGRLCSLSPPRHT